MNISDHSQTLCLMVADLPVAAKSFHPKSRNISRIGCSPQACCVNSEVSYSLGKKWRWVPGCSKERSVEEFVSRCGKDANILETEAGGLSVDAVTTWLGLQGPPTPRDYPNRAMTSIIRWAKSSGSNSCLAKRDRLVSVENLATTKKHTCHPHWYVPKGLKEDQGVEFPGRQWRSSR